MQGRLLTRERLPRQQQPAGQRVAPAEAAVATASVGRTDTEGESADSRDKRKC